MTLPKSVEEMREVISDKDGMIEVMLKMLGNTMYLKQELDATKEKLTEVSKLLLNVILNGDLPDKVHENAQMIMLSNKNFVEFANEIANTENPEDMLKAMKDNPIFDISDDMSEAQKKEYLEAWKKTKEIFTLVGMEHDLLEEE
jgi:hypothetical protein